MKSPLIVAFALFLAPLFMLWVGLQAISLFVKLAIKLAWRGTRPASSHVQPLPPALTVGILTVAAIAQYQWSSAL